MANYTQVSYGSKGSDVTELQKLLNQNGYSLDADGIFGSNTQAAVKDYQKKNNLAVDGIAGANTWAALSGSNTTPTSNSSTTSSSNSSTTSKDKTAADIKLPENEGFSYDPFKVSKSTSTADAYRNKLASSKPGEFSYGEYQESDVVRQAEALLQQQLANKPGAYQSAWQTQLDDTLNKILNREKFSYDLNGDALYQQYKDQNVTQGQQAMMDTMGQAQAMTGGYGNSYAQTAGQQTYQGYLQQLNDRVPELYQLALDQYNREGDDLYNQYGLFADRENLDYGRYRDTVSDYYTNLDYLTEDARYKAESDYNKYLDQYNMAYGQYRDSVSDWQYELGRADEDYWNQYNRDYGQWSDDRNFSYGQYSDDRAYKYQTERDSVADAQWQAEFDEAKRQYDQAYELQNGGSSGGSSGGSGGSGGNGGSGGGGGVNNGSISSSKVKDMQRALGVTADGSWGPKSQAAAKEKWGITSADDAWTYYTGNVRVPGGNGGSGDTGGGNETEEKMANYVKRMLDNATSSQFDPEAVIKANSSLSSEEKKVALEILDAYIGEGYMKF